MRVFWALAALAEGTMVSTQSWTLIARETALGFFSTRYDARSATPSLPTYLSRWHGQQRQKLPTYLPEKVFVTVRHVIKTDLRITG